MLVNQNITFVVFCAFLCTNVKSQTQWSEFFSDGNISAHPLWLGDTASFTVNNAAQLQLNAPPVAAQAGICTASKAVLNAAWEFLIRFNFNPSASNYAEVYLASEAPHPGLPQQAFLVRVGGSSQDRISLLRRNGNSFVTIAESNSGVLNSNVVHTRILVMRDSLNNWTLSADTTGGTNFKTYGTGTDATLFSSQWFFLHCVYSSTRSTGFFFDDIQVSGAEFKDETPPQVVRAKVWSSREILIDFSKELAPVVALSTAHYTLQNPPQKPDFVVLSQDGKGVRLIFRNPFTAHSTIALQIRELEDLKGNVLEDTLLLLDYFPSAYRDVVISEIMADPSPVVGLPDAEYVEIFNASNRPVDLEGWHFVADRDTFLFPGITLAPQQYFLILRHADTVHFSGIPMIGMTLPGGWLLNAGEPLALLNPEKMLIDRLDYKLHWYQNTAKQNGGWSLEIINPQLACHDHLNWTASNAEKGGTPGAQNSPQKNAGLLPPDLVNIFWKDEGLLEMQFSQGLAPGMIPPIFANLPLDSVTIHPQETNILQIWHQPLDLQEKLHIWLETGPACFGNFMADTLVISVPQSIEQGDLVLNEILFNPYSEGNDFIEVWNVSDKTLRREDLRICALNDFDEPAQVYSAGSGLILPSSLLVFSISRSDHTKFYPSGKSRLFADVSSMPSMPDGSGAIGVSTAALQLLDRLRYSEKWHHPLISNPEGVSLERINPFLPTQLAGNWHSASTRVGYATPGLPNSQLLLSSESSDKIWLSSRTISPNDDGRNDVLLIEHSLDTGAMITLRIFDLAGKPERVLADNELVEPGGAYIWDGKLDNGSFAATGIYVIFAEWFYPDGRKNAAKLSIAVSR